MGAQRKTRVGVAAIAMVLLAGLAGPAQADNFSSWNVASGHWHDGGNWTSGLPSNSTYAQIANGGTVDLLPTDGTFQAKSLSLGYAYDPGTQIISYGSGYVQQNGGYLDIDNAVSLSASGGPPGPTYEAKYTLANGTLDCFYGLTVAGAGSNTFTQTGGTLFIQNGVKGYLNIGADPVIGSARAGTYALDGAGHVTVSAMNVASLGLVDQKAGSITVDMLSVAGTYTFSGGTVRVDHGFVLTGTMKDFANVKTLDATDASKPGALIDLSAGTFAGTLVTGANSMVLYGAGGLPAGVTGTALSHAVGTTMTITASQGWQGWGTVKDHVNCAGTIDAGLSALGETGWLNLEGGLNVTGTGSVNVGGTTGAFPSKGHVYVDDTISGMSGGQISGGYMIVGHNSAGTFTHTAGTNTIGDLWISAKDPNVDPPGASAEGTYLVSGTAVVNLSGNLWLGSQGKGTFTQTGGAVTVGSMFKAGVYNSASAEGIYNLGGGTLTTGATWLAMGNGSKTTFNHTAGTYHVGTASAGVFLLVGDGTGSVANYNLSGTGVLDSTNSWVAVGSAAGTGTFTQTGGTATIGGGTWGGTRLTVGGYSGGSALYALSAGTLTLNAGSYLAVSGNGAATFDQSGGTCTTPELRLGGNYSGGDYAVAGSAGTYLLRGTGELDAGDEHVGRYNSGTFTHSAGRNALTGTLYVASGQAAATGTYELSGAATLTAPTENVGYDGTGSLKQTGGSNTVAGTLTVGYQGTASGTYEAGGGTLKVHDLVVGRDSGTSHGTGTFKITNAAAGVEVAGSLTVGQNGSLAAVPGATIHMTGAAFSFQGTAESALADLANLTLLFEGGTGTVDTLEVGGRRGGGFTNNFALGSLVLGGSDVGRVRLVDLVDNGNRVGGSECLYLSSLSVGTGSVLDLGGLPLTIAGNDLALLQSYIAGGKVISSTSTLSSGNVSYNSATDTTVVVMPEPATLGLLVLGSLALVWRRRSV